MISGVGFHFLLLPFLTTATKHSIGNGFLLRFWYINIIIMYTQATTLHIFTITTHTHTHMYKYTIYVLVGCRGSVFTEFYAIV